MSVQKSLVDYEAGKIPCPIGCGEMIYRTYKSQHYQECSALDGARADSRGGEC